MNLYCVDTRFALLRPPQETLTSRDLTYTDCSLCGRLTRGRKGSSPGALCPPAPTPSNSAVCGEALEGLRGENP